MKKTIKARVLELLEDGRILTAMEAAKLTGSGWSTTSSIMYRLFRDRTLERIPNYGPLLGYGYFMAKHSKKIGQLGQVARLSKEQEQRRSAPRSSNPYSEYTCKICGEDRNGYESHHCAKKVKCPGFDYGCRTMIFAGEALCAKCWIEQQEDPEAFK